MTRSLQFPKYSRVKKGLPGRGYVNYPLFGVLPEETYKPVNNIDKKISQKYSLEHIAKLRKLTFSISIEDQSKYNLESVVDAKSLSPAISDFLLFSKN